MNLNERRTVGIVAGILIFICVYRYASVPTKNDISTLTDNWIKAVTVKHCPVTIANMFCPDGNLVGTVSQKKRKGADIQRYFDYFAKLPNIHVVARQYNISRVTSDVYLNTAFITWMWEGLDEPIVARMTFVFRGSCIFQLHSSALPELNESLLKISNLS
tara:strand:+ start:1420 stop:1899 length:480 start_codon:yes stop_codon:yes gene_type:complete